MSWFDAVRTVLGVVAGALREGLRKRPPNVASLVVMRGLLVEQRRALARREAIARYWCARARSTDAALVRMCRRRAETPEELRELDSARMLLDRVADGVNREIHPAIRDAENGQEAFDGRLAEYCAALRTAELQGYDVSGLEYSIDEDAVAADADASWEARKVRDPEEDQVEFLDALFRKRDAARAN